MKKANSAGIKNNIYNESLIAQFISLYSKFTRLSQNACRIISFNEFLNLSSNSKIGLKNYVRLAV